MALLLKETRVSNENPSLQPGDNKPSDMLKLNSLVTHTVPVIWLSKFKDQPCYPVSAVSLVEASLTCSAVQIFSCFLVVAAAEQLPVNEISQNMTCFDYHSSHKGFTVSRTVTEFQVLTSTYCEWAIFYRF